MSRDDGNRRPGTWARKVRRRILLLRLTGACPQQEPPPLRSLRRGARRRLEADGGGAKG